MAKVRNAVEILRKV